LCSPGFHGVSGWVDRMLEINQKKPERAVLIGVIHQGQTEEQLEEYLNELAFLTETAGGTPMKRFTQKRQLPDPKTYIGSGKMQEVIEYIQAEEIQTAIFDDELTPSQLRNVEKALGIKILDRTHLILDIFAQRAQTSYARTQVELAQYQYLLPRLTRMWTHLERQRGGIGMRGPGETEIETDRRIVRDRISLLTKKLEKIDRQMATQRKNRGQMIRVALVGYTNVGKSTIMNMLSKSEVFAENKLFATLDTTVRKVVIENLPFLLSDTVGFIRKLPTHLVESFKSTLDEVREADVLVHVVDISHPQFMEQIEAVEETIAEIRTHEQKTLMVFNKIDAFTFTPKDEDDLTPKTAANYSLDDWARTWMAKMNGDCIFISATERTHLEEFRTKLYEMIKQMHAVRYPYNNFLY